LNYEIIDDFTITINYGFSDYEEGEEITTTISLLDDKIKVDKSFDGYSVMGGEYKDDHNFIFDNVAELIEWLSDEI
jgi:hypothetical protein